MQRITRPVPATILFNAVLVTTHWPALLDVTLHHQIVHIATHIVLFGAATIMWWPVVSPLPELPRISYPAQMVYLFIQTIIPTVPASFLTFASSPLYHFYTTVPGRSASRAGRHPDLGLIMKLGMGIVLWSIIAVLFSGGPARRSVPNVLTCWSGRLWNESSTARSPTNPNGRRRSRTYHVAPGRPARDLRLVLVVVFLSPASCSTCRGSGGGGGADDRPEHPGHLRHHRHAQGPGGHRLRAAARHRRPHRHRRGGRGQGFHHQAARQGRAAGSSVPLAAQNLAFSTTSLTLPPGEARIDFKNEDSAPHNVHVFDGPSASSPSLFAGAIVPREGARSTKVTGLVAGKSYFFHCDVHPTQMTGKATVAAPGASAAGWQGLDGADSPSAPPTPPSPRPSSTSRPTPPPR